MKAILALLALVGIVGSTLNVAPHVKVAARQESRHLESTQTQKSVEVPAEKKEAVLAPVEQPKAEATPAPAPAPTPPPAPKVAAPSGSCAMAYDYPWPKDVAYGICMAESGGNPGTANWGDNHGKCIGSFGLMQIGCFWYPYYGYPDSSRSNGRDTMDIAFKIWQRQGGFGAWTTYTSGKYLKYIR